MSSQNTETRLLMLNVFNSSDRPLTVIEVLSKILVKKSVNKTTIYRILEKLAAEKILSSIKLVPNVIHYELTALGHHHHLVCTDCQSIKDFPCLDNEKEHLSKINQTLKSIAFEVHNPQVTYEGLCASCKK